MSTSTEEPGMARLIRSSATYAGKQGLTYTAGVFAENAGTQQLCMHLLRIPPGGRARAHVHAGHETAIYLISGRVLVLHGEGLRHRDEMIAGDFMYIPANVPHLPINASESEEAVAVISRTDPNEQESVILLPELDTVAT
jgi:uncharacterized RmlC-like cupin family protein